MTAEMLRPKVLMIIAKFHPVIGGTENQALLLCESLIKKGLDVEVLTRKVHGLPDYAYVRGVPVNRAIKVIDRGKLFGVTYFLSCLYFLFVHRRKFDIVHCHILHGFHSMAAVLMQRLFGKHVVIKVASSGVLSDFIMLQRSLLGSCLVRSLRGADRLVALCSQAVAEARTQGFSEDRIVVIPNGVDASRFRPVLSREHSRKRIVYAGILTATKGVDVLIDAFAGLRQDYVLLRLDIFGDGPLRKSLQAKAAQLGLSEEIRFQGAVTDIERHLDSSCIFVQPSLVEGMSNVILEAMSAGLPVIATRVGAAPDIINDGVSGLLVDSGKPDQIRDAIVRIVSDDAFAQRIGRAARSVIESHYAIEVVADRYRALYNDVMDETHGS
jgi:glycosyltransferase involved in cell wall biosynthesis